MSLSTAVPWSGLGLAATERTRPAVAFFAFAPPLPAAGPAPSAGAPFPNPHRRNHVAMNQDLGTTGPFAGLGLDLAPVAGRASGLTLAFARLVHCRPTPASNAPEPTARPCRSLLARLCRETRGR
jgi:hypothetical protein